jgi:hypothetical protein
MSFTAADLKSTIWGYMDEAVKDQDLIAALNEALVKLGDRALVYVETAVEATAGSWHSLPADLISIRKIFTSSGAMCRNWRVVGGKITFPYSDTFTITHTVTPSRVTSLTDEIEIHDAFRPAIAHYVEGWLKLQDDDESIDGKRLLAQAEVEFEQISQMLKRGRRSLGRRVRVER